MYAQLRFLHLLKESYKLSTELTIVDGPICRGTNRTMFVKKRRD
jgi:hypothetical protein